MLALDALAKLALALDKLAETAALAELAIFAALVDNIPFNMAISLLIPAKQDGQPVEVGIIVEEVEVALDVVDWLARGHESLDALATLQAALEIIAVGIAADALEEATEAIEAI